MTVQNDAAIIRRALSEGGLYNKAEWQVVNDAELVLYGLKQGVGLGLIAGTGSIAIGRDRPGSKSAGRRLGSHFG